MNLESIFTNHLGPHQLDHQKLILMVSGGVDSRVLLHVAEKCLSSKKIGVFHLDHQTQDSAEHFQFVKKCCDAHKVEFFGKKITNIPSKNKEASWRESRIVAAEEARKEFGAAKVLTAHHATDLVETMLFRLTKGCGIEGLAPFDTSTKPFWQVPKNILIQYAQDQNLDYVNDHSNTDTTLQRNLIRHEVLPHLRRITPNLEQVFVKEFQMFEAIGDFVQKSLPTTKEISLIDFNTLHPALQQAWLKKIGGSGTSFTEIQDALRWLKNNPKGNSKKGLGNRELTVEKGQLRFRNK